MFDGPPNLATDADERRARVQLTRTPRIGPIAFQEALGHFGSARAACRHLDVVPQKLVLDEEMALAAHGGRFVVLGDPDYPSPLAALPDPPPVLSAIGDLSMLGRPMLAIVGARDASLAGRRFAANLSTDLGIAGFTIVSGLARGIDAAAHEAALATGTIAVLAGGIDQVYPPQNSSLHASVAAKGLLLAEAPMGTPPVARAFPRRNRIVSGLSQGVIVVEAAARSGTLITAHRAAEQGREVFVIPGSPFDPRYEGSNTLIRDGAILVRNVNDIISVFEKPQPARQVPDKPKIKYADSAYATVAEALGSVPTPVDELVRRCQVSAATVAEVLLGLELEGRLERHRGNRVSLM